jgi:hypothetical protein
LWRSAVTLPPSSTITELWRNAPARQRHAHDDARAAIGSIFGKLPHRFLAGGQKGRLHDEIFGRIAGDEQFGE